jgi:ribosomal protein S18 acetylase RimI-like enzyme
VSLQRRYRIERIDDRHDAAMRAAFDCGVPSLDAFLRTTARQHDRKGLSVVHVLYDTQDDRIAGYYALASYQIDAHALPDDLRRSLRLPRHLLPATLLSRLALDRRYQRQGLGGAILVDAMSRAAQAGAAVGSVALVVDAETEAGERLYRAHGFMPLVDERERLFLPMATAREIADAAPPAQI